METGGADLAEQVLAVLRRLLMLRRLLNGEEPALGGVARGFRMSERSLQCISLHRAFTRWAGMAPLEYRRATRRADWSLFVAGMG